MARVGVRKKGLLDLFTFGKHKGHTLQIVLDEEPEYLVWVIENVKDFPIDPVVIEMVYEEVANNAIEDEINRGGMKFSDIFGDDY